MTRYIEDLNENTAPVAGDFLLCYDASAGSTDKDRKVNVSKFAILATASTFTKTQTFAPSTTGEEGIVINMPTSTTYQALKINYTGTQRQQAYVDASTNRYIMYATDGGAGTGCYLVLERNNNASTPAAGFVQIEDRGGTDYYVHPDDSGILRIHTAAPIHGVDTTGTVVGSQSSSLDSKDVLGEFVDYDGALAAILATPLHDFTYKSGAYNGERFTGIITNYAPVFGMDRDADHPDGKSLNTINGLGYTVAAFKALTRRIEELEGKLT